MHTTRIYFPETGEPFDVPNHKAADLILNKGFCQSPVDVSGAAQAPTAVRQHDEPGVVFDGSEHEPFLLDDEEDEVSAEDEADFAEDGYDDEDEESYAAEDHEPDAK